MEAGNIRVDILAALGKACRTTQMAFGSVNTEDWEEHKAYRLPLEFVEEDWDEENDPPPDVGTWDDYSVDAVAALNNKRKQALFGMRPNELYNDVGEPQDEHAENAL